MPTAIANDATDRLYGNAYAPHLLSDMFLYTCEYTVT